LETHGSTVGTEDVPDAGRLTQELLRDMAGLQLQMARVNRDRDLVADILQDAAVTALQKLRLRAFIMVRLSNTGFAFTARWCQRHLSRR
jgi:hypothetical protein